MTKKELTKEQLLNYIAYFLISASILFTTFLLANNKMIVNFFSDSENKSFDYRQSLLVKHRHLKPSQDIVIIAIDDGSYEYILDRYGEWPISRGVYSKIIDRIEQDRPKAVIFDLMFIKSFKSDAKSDALLASTMGKYNNVYTAINFDNQSADVRTPVKLPDNLSVRLNNQSKKVDIERNFGFSNCRSIISEVYNTTTKIGMININRSEDGIIRQVPVLAYYNGQYYPHLTLLAGNEILNNGKEIKEYTIDKHSNLLLAGDYKLPLTESGEAVLNWYGTSMYTYKNIPFHKLIKSIEGDKSIEHYDFKDKIVYIGTTASSLFDTKSVPIDKIYPGVEIHATYMNNLLDKSFIRKSGTVTNALIIFLLVITVTFIVFNSTSVVFATTSTVLLSSAYYLASYYVMSFYNLWIEVVNPLFVILVTFAVSYLAKYLLKSRDFEHQYKLATTDGLTELYNHRYFQDMLRKQIESARRYEQEFSLIILDIDFFKNFNDTYGHQVGDAVLRTVAYILKKNTRATDYVCRYGGEEMSIILPQTSKEEAMINAKRICDEVAKTPLKVSNGEECHITISLGVSTYPYDGETPQKIIEYADKALYYAKNHGRNQVGEDETNG
ncbi:MAG: diguanylate cyclase [Candidatus Gastranaerophilales bacterium]|nr:diguanylate cyclase [Candidatus Gastranaerophilales bacterium]